MTEYPYWNAFILYQTDSEVTYNGGTWIALANPSQNIDKQPDTSPTYWLQTAVPQISLISAINSDTYYYYVDFLGTYPNYKTLPPFDITYTPTTNGTFVINSSALISLDESTNSIWRLKGVINDTTCGVCNVYGLSGGNTPNPGMAFVGSYVATAGQEYNITLQASQENASGDEALQNVAWSVAFYPF